MPRRGGRTAPPCNPTRSTPAFTAAASSLNARCFSSDSQTACSSTMRSQSRRCAAARIPRRWARSSTRAGWALRRACGDALTVVPAARWTLALVVEVEAEEEDAALEEEEAAAAASLLVLASAAALCLASLSLAVLALGAARRRQREREELAAFKANYAPMLSENEQA